MLDSFWITLTGSWPWYVSGPLIGLFVPLLLVLDNKAFGISANLRHLCAIVMPGKTPFFNYDWRAESWNIAMAIGVVLGGFIGANILGGDTAVNVSEQLKTELTEYSITDFSTIVPVELFGRWFPEGVKGATLLLFGGFFVGFGARWAGGCTSGHSIFGIANLEWPSIVATLCFFVGGVLMSYFILPIILSL